MASSARAHFAARVWWLLAGVAVFSLAGSDDGMARPKSELGKKCDCVCSLPNGGAAMTSYNAVDHCFAYNGKTCNVEVRDSSGAMLIKSGRLEHCAVGDGWGSSQLTTKPATTLGPVKRTPQGTATTANPAAPKP